MCCLQGQASSIVWRTPCKCRAVPWRNGSSRRGLRVAGSYSQAYGQSALSGEEVAVRCPKGSSKNPSTSARLGSQPISQVELWVGVGITASAKYQLRFAESVAVVVSPCQTATARPSCLRLSASRYGVACDDCLLKVFRFLLKTILAKCHGCHTLAR